jgi:NAD(P)-dependent dehydrogenase (short-subunit alcohol dehydrogenase family)
VLTDLKRQNNTPEGIQQLASHIPLGRLATPLEIARFVVYLSTPTNTYISGQFVAIDGGFLCH